MAYDFPNAPTNGQQVTTPGGTYQWDGQKWTSVGGGGTAPPFIEPVGPKTWGRLETGVWERSVALAGDTMTGNLAISTTTAWPTLHINRPSGSGATIIGQTGGLSRWQISLADQAPENGGNAGSDFSFSRCDDAGVFIDTPFIILRSSGATYLRAMEVTLTLGVAGYSTLTAGATLGATSSIGGAGFIYSGISATPVAFAYDTTGFGFLTSFINGAFFNVPRALDCNQLSNVPQPSYPMGAFTYVNAPNNVAYTNINDVACDAALKTNVVASTIDALTALRGIDIVAFDWNDTARAMLTADAVAHVAIGFVADQVRQLIPEAIIDVPQPETRAVGMPASISCSNDAAYTPYLIRALQQIDARLTAAGI